MQAEPFVVHTLKMLGNLVENILNEVTQTKKVGGTFYLKRNTEPFEYFEKKYRAFRIFRRKGRKIIDDFLLMQLCYETVRDYIDISLWLFPLYVDNTQVALFFGTMGFDFYFFFEILFSLLYKVTSSMPLRFSSKGKYFRELLYCRVSYRHITFLGLKLKSIIFLFIR